MRELEERLRWPESCNRQQESGVSQQRPPFHNISSALDDPRTVEFVDVITTRRFDKRPSVLSGSADIGSSAGVEIACRREDPIRFTRHRHGRRAG